MLTEFERKRLNALDCSTKVEVTEVLKLALDDIEKGEVTPDGVIVILVTRGAESQSKISTSSYRAGMPRVHEVAILSAAHARAVLGWIE